MSKDEEKSESTETEQNELSKLLDTQYPLLAEFRNTCPGTFKHSQALAGMVEGVSISLGLDTELMKVAATYHDIGKMLNPKYFTENQLDDEDLHHELDPMISYDLITRHVSDSVMILLSDANFPRRIIEIISQHHGQNVLMYFFKKSGLDNCDLFRYKTTKPTCIESAILMICDAIEATSRSQVQAGTFDPAKVIESTINGLIDDGQLDDVVMKLGHLKQIKIALGKELEGTYQKRVDYSKALKDLEVSSIDEPATTSG